jgi:hypothetical protein
MGYNEGLDDEEKRIFFGKKVKDLPPVLDLNMFQMGASFLQKSMKVKREDIVSMEPLNSKDIPEWTLNLGLHAESINGGRLYKFVDKEGNVYTQHEEVVRDKNGRII